MKTHSERLVTDNKRQTLQERMKWHRDKATIKKQLTVPLIDFTTSEMALRGASKCRMKRRGGLGPITSQWLPATCETLPCAEGKWENKNREMGHCQTVWNAQLQLSVFKHTPSQATRVHTSQLISMTSVRKERWMRQMSSRNNPCCAGNRTSCRSSTYTELPPKNNPENSQDYVCVSLCLTRSSSCLKMDKGALAELQ